ncbi:MAG: stage II sporulation protein M [Anaerolineae bacterium]|jgi:uncharacterized membrane protein SpoIIM required for sporulation/ABC-type transport system involved in multi-copper enzyme maturation permease subunit|nr:stage II sporulation protein M [Anaerolineae bacterium]
MTAISRSSWRDTLANALIITRREVRDSFRDWRIIAPIVVLTFLFPALAQFVAARFSAFLTGFGAEIIGDRTIPFLLMIVGFFPISISLVIALETFVGEKERRSLEPLLSTPLTNTELYIGKTLAAMIPPLVSSYGGMFVYLLSLLGGELEWRPAPMLVVQIILLTTVQALVMVTGAVVVSSQTTSTRAANLLASFVIIPMALVVQGESVIMFLAPDADSPYGIGALWAIMVGMIVAVVLFLRVGNTIFNREELLGRALDQINLKNFFGKVWRAFRSIDRDGTPAPNLWVWYTRGMAFTLGRMRSAIGVTIMVFLIAFIGGLAIGQLPEWRLPFDFTILGTINPSQATVFNEFLGSGFEAQAIGFIAAQNGRILLAALLLSVFSFGVMALVLTPAVYVILGYIASQVATTGTGLALISAAILPHGVIEIPMIVIATAAALRLGAVVTRPPDQMTVGQAWTFTFGETLKILIGLILPMLIFAAVLESVLTPRVVLWVLGGS